MRRRKRRLHRLFRDIVRQRMEILFDLSVNAARRGDLAYSRMLGEAIRKLHTGTRVPIPAGIKRSICKNCSAPLIPGLTATIRLRSQGKFSYLVVKCAICGWIHRYPYKR